jgi:dTDP-4-amino-4,6-dideoxygalactose transaminase
MTVPLLDINRQHAPILEELREAFEKALSTSRFIKGPELEEFEKEFADYCTTGRAVGCASGTDALILSLQAVDADHGCEVITTPFTFFATAGAISRVGSNPVFIDILPDTFNMDPARLNEWLEINCRKQNGKTYNRSKGNRIGAVIPVHLFGQVCDMDMIMDIAGEWEIPVIEDASQAVGSTWNSRKAGSFGIAGCFSFFPSKNLGALGDAGAIVTNDEKIADRIARLREHGGSGYFHSEIGKNSRMDALQAAFLRIKLRLLENWHERRRNNAVFYNNAFDNLQGIEAPVISDAAVSIYNQYTIRCLNKRDELLDYLRKKEIGCAVYYPLPLHLQECFNYLGYDKGDFPVSEKASEEVLSIPVFGELREDELKEVADIIGEFTNYD